MKKPTPPKTLWEQMDAITGPPLVDSPGISIKEFGRRHRLNFTNSKLRLDRLVAEGKLIQGKRKTPTGHLERVYRPK